MLALIETLNFHFHHLFDFSLAYSFNEEPRVNTGDQRLSCDHDHLINLHDDAQFLSKIFCRAKTNYLFVNWLKFEFHSCELNRWAV